jgi:hypothetical protein
LPFGFSSLKARVGGFTLTTPFNRRINFDHGSVPGGRLLRCNSEGPAGHTVQ